MQTIAITGATGFLGRHLIAKCLSHGGFNIRVLTRNADKIKDVSSNSVRVYEGNLLKPDSLVDFLKGDITLINLAYIKNDLNSNIEATHNLVDAVMRASVKRMIHCSTAVVVGPKARGVITEDVTPEPRGDYQQIKFKIEKMLLDELAQKVELAILRPTEIIGPGGEGLRTMIDRLNNDGALKRFVYHSLLKNRRFNYVSVYNVVAALVLLASTKTALIGEIYNVSDDDDENSYGAVEKIICSGLNIRCGYPFDIGLPRTFLSYIFRLMPNCSSPDLVYSCDKLRSLGYKKTVTLRSAVAEMVSTHYCGRDLQ